MRFRGPSSYSRSSARVLLVIGGMGCRSETSELFAVSQVAASVPACAVFRMHCITKVAGSHVDCRQRSSWRNSLAVDNYRFLVPGKVVTGEFRLVFDQSVDGRQQHPVDGIEENVVRVRGHDASLDVGED